MTPIIRDVALAQVHQQGAVAGDRLDVSHRQQQLTPEAPRQRAQLVSRRVRVGPALGEAFRHICTALDAQLPCKSIAHSVGRCCISAHPLDTDADPTRRVRQQPVPGVVGRHNAII